MIDKIEKYKQLKKEYIRLKKELELISKMDEEIENKFSSLVIGKPKVKIKEMKKTGIK